jgi:hypothetical protein
MRGLFGGELEDRDGTSAALPRRGQHQNDGSVEPVPPELAGVLRKATPRGPLPELLEGAELVLFDVNEEGAVRYGKKLPPSLGSLAAQRTAALDALARAASAIGALHAADTCHGDLGLGADIIRVLDGGGVVVLMSAKRPAPGALVGARLSGGAPPVVASFSAPEVIIGYEATAASDVYALSAMAHEIVTGCAPLGQIDFADAQRGPFADLAAWVKSGLAANPSSRPTAEGLAGALRRAAAIAHGLEAPGRAGPYRGAPVDKAPPAHVRSAAEGSAKMQQASSMSRILMLLLAMGGLFVFSGAVWLAAVTWSVVGGLAHLSLLVALTWGILLAGRALGRGGYAGSGRALVVLGIELFWADGAYLLDISGKLNDTSGWSLLAATMTVVAFGLAGILDSGVFGVLAALHYALFAGVLGFALQSGAPTGPATYTLAVSVVAAGIAGAGHRWRRERLGFPFAGLSALTAIASALAGVALIASSEHRLFGTLWPYAVVGLAATPALAFGVRYGIFSAAATGVVLAIVPTIEALVGGDLIYLLAAAGIGFSVLAAAFLWPRFAREERVQTAWILVGLASVTTSPTLFFLGKCWGQDGLDALGSADGIYLALVIAIATTLVGASYAFARPTPGRLTYRLLELAGVSMIFGTFTIQSIARYKDTFYPLAILGLDDQASDPRGAHLDRAPPQPLHPVLRQAVGPARCVGARPDVRPRPARWRRHVRAPSQAPPRRSPRVGVIAVLHSDRAPPGTRRHGAPLRANRADSCHDSRSTSTRRVVPNRSPSRVPRAPRAD